MAFLQSQPPREPFLHAPAIVLWMIGAFVAIHLATVLAPGTFTDSVLLQYAFVPARYAHGANAFELTVPLVSHMFLHGGYVHLAVNCFWFLAFAPIIARRYGTALFLVFFFTCGIAGALTYLGFNWGSPEAVIGASGGISGLMASGIRMLRWPNVPTRRGLAPVLSRPVLMFTAFWLVTNLVLGVIGVGTGEEVQQVAWQAHLGGFFCGLFLIDAIEWVYARGTH
jgi:membrane associated rhomboid family serine protease